MTTLEELPARVDALTVEVFGLKVEVSDLRKEIREEFSAIRGEMATRSHMLMLHEEVLDRISRIGEGRSPRKNC